MAVGRGPVRQGRRPLPLGRSGQHHRGRVHVHARRLHRHHRPAGHLPGHPSRSFGPGQHRLSPVDDHGLPPGAGGHRGDLRAAGRHVRPGQDLQRRVRRVHRLVHPPFGVPVHGCAGRAVAHRVATRAGAGRVDAHRQLGGHPDRCLPEPAAGVRARPQPGGRAGRHVRRPGRRRAAGGGRLAPGLLGQCPGRGVRHAVGLLEAPRDQRPAGGTHRLVGQPDLRRRAGRHPGRRHLRDSAVRAPCQGLDEPDGRRPHHRRRCCCWARSW